MDITINDVKNIIFNKPATIVIWNDGTKTVVKCAEGDAYDEEKGVALCFMKHAMGDTGNFNEVLKKYLPKSYETKGRLVFSLQGLSWSRRKNL